MGNFQGIIDRLEGDTAVLRFSDNQELRVALVLLPDNIKEGSVINVSLSGDEEETEQRQVQAKELLNQILKVQ